MNTAIDQRRPLVGLALSGGAARGMAHVGVLRVLKDNDIPIDFIAGTSAGALVGGAFAAGVPVDEIEDIARKLRWRDVGRVTLSRLGVQTSERMEEFIRARFPVTRFEDLKIPFVAVATDLNSGTPAVLGGEGDVAFAIRASSCIPGWYIPVTDEKGRQLVDGALVANIPTAAVRDLGADIVIAVDVNAEGAKFLGPPQSAIGIIIQSMMVIQRTGSSHQLSLADVVIRPKIGHIRWDEISRAGEFIEAGKVAALEMIDRIKELVSPLPVAELEPQEQPGRWYQFRRRRRGHRESDEKLVIKSR
jgi:NTE family protein